MTSSLQSSEKAINADTLYNETLTNTELISKRFIDEFHVRESMEK